MIDSHTQYAAELYGIAPEDVTPEQRATAKRRRYIDLYSVGGPIGPGRADLGPILEHGDDHAFSAFAMRAFAAELRAKFIKAYGPLPVGATGTVTRRTVGPGNGLGSGSAFTGLPAGEKPTLLEKGEKVLQPSGDRESWLDSLLVVNNYTPTGRIINQQRQARDLLDTRTRLQQLWGFPVILDADLSDLEVRVMSRPEAFLGLHGEKNGGGRLTMRELKTRDSDGVSYTFDLEGDFWPYLGRARRGYPYKRRKPVSKRRQKKAGWKADGAVQHYADLIAGAIDIDQVVKDTIQRIQYIKRYQYALRRRHRK